MWRCPLFPLGGIRIHWAGPSAGGGTARSWTQYVQAVRRPTAGAGSCDRSSCDTEGIPVRLRPDGDVHPRIRLDEEVGPQGLGDRIRLDDRPLPIQLAAILVLIFLLADFGRFVQAATGFVFLLWTAVLATQDRRSLLAAGHSETASPWWLLLSPLAYLIARTVKVRNTTGSGAAPLWTYLALAIIPAIGVFGYLSTAGAMNLVLMAASH